MLKRQTTAAILVVHQPSHLAWPLPPRRQRAAGCPTPPV